MQEVDGAELGVRTGPGARALERAADGAQQDAEHGTGEVWVAGRKGRICLGRESTH